MATVAMIWSELQNQIISAFAGTNPLLPNQTTAIFPVPIIADDWPPVQTIGGVSIGQLPTVISIFDRGGEKNITTAINLFYALPPTAGVTGAALALNTDFLPPGGVVTLTGAGTPLVNDSFCLTLISGAGGQNEVIAQYKSLGTDTLTTALTNFTAQINTLDDISAVLSGPVITITNGGPSLHRARAEVVNIGTFTQEGFRWDRDVQVTVWSRTPADRSKYGDILEQLFSQLEVNFGFLTVDQSACRVQYVDDHVWRDSQLQDIYRRDFILTINYPLLNQIPAYAIEAIPQTYSEPIPD